METLLSHSFDYLSSPDPSKIRKGLRQVEGLLAQICLSRSSKTTAAEKRRSMIQLGTSSSSASSSKPLIDLKDDPAFREFFKLQEGFQWNVAMRLISTLERLMGKGSNGQNDLLIIATLDLIQGVMLLHPPSRELFRREIYMNVRPCKLRRCSSWMEPNGLLLQLLLDLLDPSNCPAIQCSTLLTLVSALLSNPANTRTFETLDGLLTVTSLFKLRSTSREVKLKLVEFLYFYLMPETPTIPLSASAPNTAVLGLHRSPSKLAGAFSRSTVMGGEGSAGSGVTKTTEEKQNLLGKYLNNVEDLVEDLQESAPFGGTVY